MLEVSIAARETQGSVQREAIVDADRLVLVAEVDGVIVGWAKTHLYDEASASAPAGHYLGGVNVLPKFRRKGIGSALTRARLAWIWEREAAAWYVANARNAASIGLHAHLGFSEVARSNEFHGTTFEGDVGILFCAIAPNGQIVLSGPGAGNTF